MNTNNLKNTVIFKSLEVERDLQSNLISVSDEKQASLTKNYINRLKANKAFINASQSSLETIVKYSDIETLEYLMNPSNYKTASRILDAAKMLNSEKYSTILDYTLSALKRSPMQKTSVDSVCNIANQCYARVSNAVKALAFFDLIEVSDVTTNGNIIVKMSKSSMIQLKIAE
ncbi:MAG: hypothetical protein ACXWTU_00445 [Methylotenera sp.]